MPRLLTWCVLLLSWNVSRAAVLTKVVISGEEFPQAICNDGSPGPGGAAVVSVLPREAARGLRALLVLDDVWEAAHAE